ncbi:Elongator subunit elp4 [Didymosphaeria variabile]|uniref:Elongator complex protein 4 n=1 Tax=Didymosphaeria variabile TaxID=1932322 RepID=A0A9W8XIH8_9PLEO|nr:Elongator subunit elp4 [Didymosphaeria variabile]KAJ4351547.1 Elongator subunit elp4 [Didymosphaeria variabile]
MAFRKRNVALARPPAESPASETPSSPASNPIATAPAPGTRPSPIDGRPTTSTGTPSLDSILAGHAGLSLGNSLLIGESGTTDYAGALLRFYAAEGVVQGHKVHVVGMGEVWGRELPGIAEEKDKRKEGKERAEKMKIAWRYEGLGAHGSSRERGSPFPSTGDAAADEAAVFCHTFDLARRLTLPVGSAIDYVPIPRTSSSPFTEILRTLQKHIARSPPDSIHRLVIPSLLSPALYPPTASHPAVILPFLHGLRALLRKYSTRLTAIMTLPLTLYPRSSGVVRWMEILSDGVFELSPFPYSHHESLATSAGTTKDEERPQGMFAVHKLPVFHERGGGGSTEGLGEELAFTLSRRKFVVAKFSLPPLEGDTEAQEAAVREASGNAMPRKEDLEF